jgi:2-isopropylmalate synthase
MTAITASGIPSILDTTLRDGALAEEVSLSVADKLRILPLIDSLGVDYIELGWPQVFPNDLEFCQRAQELGCRAKLLAFGATRRPETLVERDAGLRNLLAAGTPVVQLYGKVWPLHVEKVLRTTLAENLAMLRDSLEYVRQAGRETLVIAEHFFDALVSAPDYALQFVQAAAEAGAGTIVLGDSNGRSLPAFIREGLERARSVSGSSLLGVHLHNDFGLALANALAAIEGGAEHLQGSVNGYGARNGITDLCALLPIMKLKLGLEVVSDAELTRLTPVAQTIAELVGLAGEMNTRPFVGRSVFSHKTETHIAAVLSDPEAYEPIAPEKVGNQRRLIIPGVSRPSYLAQMAEQFGVDLSQESAANGRILAELRRLEDEGYSFEDAPASLELLVSQLTGRSQPVLSIERVRIFDAIRGRERPVVEASLRAQVGQAHEYVAAEAPGPIAALFKALKLALSLGEDKAIGDYGARIECIDLKARTLPKASDESQPRARLSLTFTDGQRQWTTVGISQDVLQAAWKALVDGVEYGLATRES